MSSPALFLEETSDQELIKPYDEESTPRSWSREDPNRHSRAAQTFRDIIPIGPSLGWKHALESAKESRYLLKLGDNWDDEGSAGYSYEIWKRATDFLMAHARLARDVLTVDFPPPKISAAEAGSIDLFWRQESRTLLINIPSDPQQLATYFGDAKSGDTVAGELKVDKARIDLIAWLTAPE